MRNLLVLFSIISLCSCGFEDYPEQTVASYHFDTCYLPSCPNVDHVEIGIGENGKDEVIVCKWSCAAYKGYYNRWVGLIFTKSIDGCFYLTKEINRYSNFCTNEEKIDY